jgi:nicotinate phosphoribosyltransferase
MTHRKTIEPGTVHEELLVPIFKGGKPVYDPPPLAQIRQRTFDQLAALHPTIRRFPNPHRYPAGLEENLFNLRNELILKARGFARGPTAEQPS